MNKINLAFFGSAYFSATLLEGIINDEELKKRLDLKFVVTQPDKPSGRKQVMTPTPVKQVAVKHGILVRDYDLEMRESKTGVKFGILRTDKINVGEYTKLDLALVYAYGAIISDDILNIPGSGFWNIHPSLLPLYRGTAPMATPLIKGDKNTGVTIIKMDNKMDHGPIIDQISYTIAKSDKRPDLETKLTDMGFKLFKKTVLNKDSLQMQEQDHSKATYTEKLKKDEGFIELEELNKKIKESPEELYNLYRGLYPWPGIWTLLRQGFGGQAKRLKITDMEILDGKIIIKKVQLEGKNEVDFKTFNSHYRTF